MQPTRTVWSSSAGNRAQIPQCPSRTPQQPYRNDDENDTETDHSSVGRLMQANPKKQDSKQEKEQA